MSDERLRQLDRRWRETGAIEDEAALLQERVRVGNLRRERLELAALLGSQGAQLATGFRSLGAVSELPSLISMLGHHGTEALAQAAAAVAQAVWSEWQWNRDGRLVDALAATEAWIACPCPVHAAGARKACDAATWARAEFDDPSPAGHGANAIRWAAALAWRADRHATDGVESDALRAVKAAERLLGERTETVIGARLIEWALRPEGSARGSSSRV